MNRSANRGARKDTKKWRVRAADAILAIDRRDCADHAFEHLRAELSFAARRFGALPRLPKSTLDLPDCFNRDHQTKQDGYQGPGSNRAGCGSLHRFAAVKDLLLLDRRVMDDVVQLGIH